MSAAQLDEVFFEEDAHLYRNGDGVVVPSVTQVLKYCDIYNFDHVDPNVLEYKRELGSNVHSWTARIDLGTAYRDGLYDEMNEEEAGYSNQWFRFQDDARVSIEQVELRIMGAIDGIPIAGTLDRELVIGRRPWRVEIKCSTAAHPGWGLQLALYDMLRSRSHDPSPWGRMAVMLTPTRYSTKYYADVADYAAARACVRYAYDPDDKRALALIRTWKKNHRLALA